MELKLGEQKKKYHKNNPDFHKLDPKKNYSKTMARYNQRPMIRTTQKPAEREICQRRVRWIGYTLRK